MCTCYVVVVVFKLLIYKYFLCLYVFYNLLFELFIKLFFFIFRNVSECLNVVCINVIYMHLCSWACKHNLISSIQFYNNKIKKNNNERVK